jgi:hypothetical protein
MTFTLLTAHEQEFLIFGLAGLDGARWLSIRYASSWFAWRLIAPPPRREMIRWRDDDKTVGY